MYWVEFFKENLNKTVPVWNWTYM